MDIQESKSDGRGHDSRDGDQGSPESDGRPFCKPDQVSGCDPEPSISNRTHTEGISTIPASFFQPRPLLKVRAPMSEDRLLTL